MNLNSQRAIASKTAVLTFFAAFMILCSNSSAQYQQFAFTNADFTGNVITQSGASAAHLLKVTVRTNGSIQASGRRYDIGAASASPSPVAGTVVSNLATKVSTMGGPIVTTTNIGEVYSQPVQTSPNSSVIKLLFTNWSVSTMCPASLFLNDGSVLKGAVTVYRSYNQNWDYESFKRTTNVYTNRYFGGQMIYGGGYGSGSTQD